MRRSHPRLLATSDARPSISIQSPMAERTSQAISLLRAGFVIGLGTKPSKYCPPGGTPSAFESGSRRGGGTMRPFGAHSATDERLMVTKGSDGKSLANMIMVDSADAQARP